MQNDRHRRRASQLFCVPEDQVTPEQRRAGKDANLMMCYGGFKSVHLGAGMLWLQRQETRSKARGA